MSELDVAGTIALAGFGLALLTGFLMRRSGSVNRVAAASTVWWTVLMLGAGAYTLDTYEAPAFGTWEIQESAARLDAIILTIGGLWLAGLIVIALVKFIFDRSAPAEEKQ